MTMGQPFLDGQRMDAAPPAGLFIVGADTGVGKTVVACAIARLLANHGVDVGVMKPVETGCRMRKGQLFPADGAALKAAARSEVPLAAITSDLYRLPLAPYVAAQMAWRPVVNLGRVVQCFQAQRRQHAFMIVEGIGGLLVPLSARRDLIDLILALDLPTLLVARSGLGTLNHVLLTLRHGSDRGVRFVGVVLNHTTSRQTLADKTNPAVLAARCALPVFSFPYFKQASASGEDAIALALAHARRTPAKPATQGLRQRVSQRNLERNEKAESFQQWLLHIVKKTAASIGRRTGETERMESGVVWNTLNVGKEEKAESCGGRI